MVFLKWKVNPIFSVTDVTSVTNCPKNPQTFRHFVWWFGMEFVILCKDNF